MMADCRLRIAEANPRSNPESQIRNPQSPIRNRFKGPIAQPGQSYRLITGWSLVRIQVGPLPSTTAKSDLIDAPTIADCFGVASLRARDKMIRWQKTYIR